ncbi:protein sidekick-2-like [Bacillus rossius redtenbacheri]|uniref:protein sidekick-2-like n=1 Tax=Bacillus rossius redtenbacheri TaxID=93214 RepID=UPI002FDE9B9E
MQAASAPVETAVTQAGANVTLACPGVSEHSLVFTLEWRARARLVEYAGESTTVWEHRRRLSLEPGSFALRIRPVESGDSGVYSCLVNNRPQPEALVRLVVQDVPDPPGRPLIMGFTSRAVNLSWAPPQDTHNSPIMHYIIQVRVGEEGDWDQKNAIVTEANETSHQVGGLLPYTVYSFRVLAVNAMGPSRASKESYYMVTLREVPDGRPTITTAHNTSATSIYLSWRAPARDSIHGEFLGYRIEYRPREQRHESVKEIYIRDANVDSHTITNLETYTQYRVSLQVFNPEGPGPSTTVLVMTDEGECRSVTIPDLDDLPHQQMMNMLKEFVPRLLADDHKPPRIEISQELPDTTNANEKFLENITTGDETENYRNPPGAIAQENFMPGARKTKSD